jgi:flavin reductase (DIM6/NTAB) family NADH-FMN oxidoreductase RutF
MDGYDGRRRVRGRCDLDCSIHAEVPAGDHDVILLRVHGLRVDTDIAPLVFHGSRFRRLAMA